MVELDAVKFKGLWFRTVVIEGVRWWYMSDIQKIIGLSAKQIIRLLDDGETQKYLQMIRIANKAKYTCSWEIRMINYDGIAEVSKRLRTYGTLKHFAQWALNLPEKLNNSHYEHYRKGYVALADGELKPDISSDEVNSASVDIDEKANAAPVDIDEKDNAIDEKEDAQPAEDIKPSVNSKTKTSTEIAIQKASLMVRIAEHKAVPQSEQLRLLDMAVKELVGIGFSAEDMTKLLPHSDNLKAEVISTVISSSHKLPTIDIMSLPEVVGAVHEKKSVYIGSYEYVFYPTEVLAGIVKASVQDLNASAVKYNLKTDYTGIWERVKTPSGEAREFLYFEGFPNLPNIVKLRNLKTVK